MAKKVTMADVARAAGVSKSTVSAVLGKKGNVRISDETNQLVLDTANQLGYKVNYFASAMNTGTSQCIGFFHIHNHGKNSSPSSIRPFTFEIRNSLERSLAAQHYQIFTCSNNATQSRTEALLYHLDFLKQNRIDALVISANSLEQKHIDIILQSELDKPVIVYHFDPIDDYPLPGIYLSCEQALSDAANYTLQYLQAQQKLLYINVSDELSDAESSTFRDKKYAHIFKQLNINCETLNCSIDKSAIQSQDPAVKHYHMDAFVAGQVHETIDAFLKEHHQHFGAIICYNDAIGLAVQRTLSGLHLDIPIIGFDNSVSETQVHPFSSIDPQHERCGKMLADICLELVNTEAHWLKAQRTLASCPAIFINR